MLRRFFEAPPDPSDILGIPFRRSRRARRMALRVDARARSVILTVPFRMSLKKAEIFVAENAAWIERHRAALPNKTDVRDGMELTVWGRTYTLRHAAGRGLTRFEGHYIIIHGDPAHMRRRLMDFLKKEMLDIIKDRVCAKAAMLDVTVGDIVLRDPRSRWGSCAPDGRLMFSWRLCFAPPHVFDYVVAHEVAHRRHMNHSRAFWQVCKNLTADAPSARRWLRQNGAQLMCKI